MSAMRPPICRICEKRMEDINDGGLIYFKKRQSDIEWEKNMEEIGGVGHPPYAEWFCKNNYEKANDLRDLTLRNAIRLLKTE
ncbi:hypothetical protein LCGC14_0721980 [marine sediment metagenome]|uniref:Uncharacterized protein n=1 Tax=marine sediment metagenome TaxID=412755 RepID=A0A0F9QGB5_9ZZZZ